jgi:hypothetical protein
MRRFWLGLQFVAAVAVIGSAGSADPPRPEVEGFEQRGARSHPENLVVNGSFESRRDGEPPVNIESFVPGGHRQ